MRHVLYETGDVDAPEAIKDRNGEVVLGLCRVCGKGEIELDEICSSKGVDDKCSIWQSLDIETEKTNDRSGQEQGNRQV